ncbi:hypothetical protein [Hydrogenibacillus schlegelii]|nr:hypothetical protein [Hydrogenibacillus schlegelii]
MLLSGRMMNDRIRVPGGEKVVWRVEPINTGVMSPAELDQLFYAYRQFLGTLYVPVSIYAVTGYVDLDRLINDFAGRAKNHPVFPPLLAQKIEEHLRGYVGRVRATRYYLVAHFRTADTDIESALHTLEAALHGLSQATGLLFYRLDEAGIRLFLADLMTKEAVLPELRLEARREAALREGGIHPVPKTARASGFDPGSIPAFRA